MCRFRTGLESVERPCIYTREVLPDCTEKKIRKSIKNSLEGATRTLGDKFCLRVCSSSLM
jgi:hypothetical protein